MAERLSALELDFLSEALRAGELPYPLRVRSHGESVEERAGLRGQVMAGLARRGLVDDGGTPQPWLEDAFEVLVGSEVSLDSIQLVAQNAQPRLAVAAAIGGEGVLAVQEGYGLYLERVPADGLASAIVGQLPPASRGTEKSITVPIEQLLAGPGADFMQRRASAPQGGVGTADTDRKALARLHAQERLRGGQLGANARGRSGGRSRMPVLSWFDTETGRYFTQASRGQDNRDWIIIAPADAATLRHRLSEMLANAVNSTAAPL